MATLLFYSGFPRMTCNQPRHFVVAVVDLFAAASLTLSAKIQGYLFANDNNGNV